MKQHRSAGPLVLIRPDIRRESDRNGSARVIQCQPQRCSCIDAGRSREQSVISAREIDHLRVGPICQVMPPIGERPARPVGGVAEEIAVIVCDRPGVIDAH